MQKRETQVLLKDRGQPEIVNVYEEPPIETRYVPYKPSIRLLPDIPVEDFREAVDAIADNTGKAVAWSGYIVVRAGAVVLLVFVHILKAVAITLKAVVTLLLSALTGPTREDVDWGPAPDCGRPPARSRRTGSGNGGGINININIENNEING